MLKLEKKKQFPKITQHLNEINMKFVTVIKTTTTTRNCCISESLRGENPQMQTQGLVHLSVS